MKLPVSNIVQESFQEFPPYISMVVFMGGCNLDCYRCPNKTYNSNYIGLEVIRDKLMANPMVDGLVILGGEPSLHPVEVENILGLGLELGKHTKVFTNGCKPHVLKDWLSKGLLSSVSIDLKTLSKFELISQTDIKSEEYLMMFNECMRIVKDYPGVELEVRTTELYQGNSPLTDTQEVIEYMKEKYPLVKHILQTDAFEFMKV